MSDTLINNAIYQILDQPADGFVPFNTVSIFGPGGQNAYNYICSQIGVTGDIRQLYYNPVFDHLNDWEDDIKELIQAGFPASQTGFTPGEYSLVLSTLESELENASDVGSYFSDLKAVYLKCFTIEEATFQDLLLAVGLDDKSSQKVSGLVSDVMIGMATTLGGDLIPGGSIFIGILETTAEGYGDAENILQGPQPPDAFTKAVTDLDTHLIKQFQTLSVNLDNIWKRIVADPGKMEQFSQLKGNPQGGIFWTPADQENFINAATKAFQLELLKLLLPINHAIYFGYINTQLEKSPNQIYFPDDINPVTWDRNTVVLSANTPQLVVPYNGSQFQNSSNYDQGEKIYWIALKTDAESFLDSEVIYELINGMSDCFLGLNGWNMVPALYGWSDAVSVRVVNNTSASITVNAQCWKNFTLIYATEGTHIGASQNPITLTVDSGEAVDFLGTAISSISNNAFSVTLSGDGIGKQAYAFTVKASNMNVTPAGPELLNNQAIINIPTNKATSKGTHGGGCVLLVADAVLANGLKKGTTNN